MSSDSNPYRDLRKRMGWSIIELAEAAGISGRVIMDTEVGLYLEPPPSVTSCLVRACRGSHLAPKSLTLREGYHLWVEQQRIRNRDSFKLEAKDWEFITSAADPWLAFRMTVHPALRGFCRLLVFDVRVAQGWENNGNNWGRVMSALRAVLPKTDLERLLKLVLEKKVIR